MKKSFKVSLKSHFNAIETGLIIGFLLLLVIFYMDFDPEAISFFATAYLIILVPAVYLHLEYLSLNKGVTVVIDDDNSIIIVTAGERTTSLKFEQIACVDLFFPPSAFRGPIASKMRFLPMEAYGYAIVYSDQGDKITLTSLIIPDIPSQLKIPGVLVRRRKRLLASPSVERLIQWFAKDGL